MDIKVKSRGLKDNRKKVKTISSGINDFSIKKHKKSSPSSSGNGNKQPSKNDMLMDDDDDDFMFEDIQNKSKVLPDDEFMLDDDEEFAIDDDDEFSDDNRDEFSDGDDEFSDDDEDDFSDDDDDEDGEFKAPGESRKSHQEIQMEKQRYLIKIDRIAKQGFPPKRKLTMQSKLSDIKFEHECVFNERGLEKSIKEWREDTVLFAAGGEKANEWAGSRFHLKDWSKQVYRDTQDGDLDPIFEQLHDKYGGSSMFPPEIQLAKALGMSAIRFHFSHQVAKDSPSIHEMLEKNPTLRNQVYAKMQEQATANWAGRPNGPPTSGPGPMSMGPTGAMKGSSSVNPLSNRQMPEQARNTNGSAKMQGPSSSTEELLKKDLSKINDDGLSFEDTILSDDDGDDMTFSINDKKGKGMKGKQFMNIATVDL